MEKPKRKPKKQGRYPIEFVSPFSLEECVARLEVKQGNYMGTKVKVSLHPVDDDMYQFQLHGTHIGRHDSTKDIAAFGYLERDEESTRVAIEGMRMGYWGYVRIAIEVVLFLVIVFVIQLLSRDVALLRIFPLLALVAVLLLWMAQKDKGRDELIGMIEETLTYSYQVDRPSESLVDRLVEKVKSGKSKLG